MRGIDWLIGGLGTFVKVGATAGLPAPPDIDDDTPVPSLAETYQKQLENPYEKEIHRDLFNAVDRNNYKYTHYPEYNPYFSPFFNPAQHLSSERVNYYKQNAPKLQGNMQHIPLNSPLRYIPEPPSGKTLPNLGSYFNTNPNVPVSEMPNVVGTSNRRTTDIRIREDYNPKTGNPDLRQDFPNSWQHEGGHSVGSALKNAEEIIYGKDTLPWFYSQSARMSEFPSSVAETLYGLYGGYPFSNVYKSELYPNLPPDNAVFEASQLNDHGEEINNDPRWLLLQVAPEEYNAMEKAYQDYEGPRIPFVPQRYFVDQEGRNIDSFEFSQPLVTGDGNISPEDNYSENYSLILRNIGGMGRAYRDATEKPEIFWALREDLQRRLTPVYAYYRPMVGPDSPLFREAMDPDDVEMYDEAIAEGHVDDVPTEIAIPFTVKQIVEDATSGDPSRYERARKYAPVLRPDIRNILLKYNMEDLHRIATEDPEAEPEINTILRTEPYMITPEMVEAQHEFSITPGFDQEFDFRSIDQMTDIYNFLQRGFDRNRYYELQGGGSGISDPRGSNTAFI